MTIKQRINNNDAAGRLAKENNKVYQYTGLDKVTNILEDNKVISSYQYSIGGQLASATADGTTENFLWDGLALIRRGDTDYTNEPYVTGGNPVVAGDKILFNDILGNTVGIKSEDKLKVIKMTAFGETADKDAFFTGKPAVNNLGYSFLFRNYRADQGKWLSQDPIALTVTLPSPESSGSTRSSSAQLGYPDGWNNLAYCNNNVIDYFDRQGTIWVQIGGTRSGQEEHYWLPTTDNAYQTEALAYQAASNFTVGCRDGIYQNLVASNKPDLVIMESWDQDVLVRPMVGGSGLWYIAKANVTYKYTVWRQE